MEEEEEPEEEGDEQSKFSLQTILNFISNFNDLAGIVSEKMKKLVEIETITREREEEFLT